MIDTELIMSGIGFGFVIILFIILVTDGNTK